MKDLAERVMIRVEFALADGTTLERDWTWAEVEAGNAPTWQHDGPPDWLDDPKRKWPHPQDPITYMGSVKAGSEAEARAVVEVAS